MKQVLVIIPTYNEAANIDQVIEAVEQVAHHLRSYSFSLLIVDDNSPDGTGKKVKTLQKKYHNIHLLSGQKAGLGKAYIHGISNALKRYTFDICILMDGDMSHNPKDIPALLKAINSGADYVIGSRYISGGTVSKDWPFRRVIMSRIANVVTHKLVGINDDVMDLTGGFKAMRGEALEKIDMESLHARGYIFQVSLLHAFIRNGFIVREVPITFSNRNHGTSKLNLKDIIEFIYRAYKLNPDASIQRFVRFGFVGACGSVVNLVVLSFLVKIVQVDALIAVVCAIEISILFNFFLNHVYTFRGYGSYAVKTHSEQVATVLCKMGIYNIGALGGAVISFVTFTVLFKLAGINYLVADVMGIIIALSWNYYVSTRYVWKVIDEEL